MLPWSSECWTEQRPASRVPADQMTEAAWEEKDFSAFPKPLRTHVGFRFLQPSLKKKPLTVALMMVVMPQCRLSRVCPFFCRQIRRGGSRLR